MWNKKKEYKFAVAIKAGGTLAQLVEQWTENPCVPGSIPGGTTNKEFYLELLFYLNQFKKLYLRF